MAGPLKIAVVHSFYGSSSPSGENQVVESQVRSLEAAGHEVRVIGRRTEDVSRGVLYRTRVGLTTATGRGPSPVGAIRDFSPDIVHVHNLFPNWGQNWLRGLGVPVVASIHNFRPLCAAGTLYLAGNFCNLCPTKGSRHAVANRCYRDSAIATIPLAIASRESYESQFLPQHVDRLIFLSDDQRLTYETLSSTLPHARVIRNFVPDIDAIPDPVTPSEGWCYIGRISEEKGVLDLLAHWPRDRKLNLYGDGPAVGEVMRSQSANISYHGPLDNSRVPEVLATHQGLMFPSKVSEVSPLSYIEALRSGRPVVAFAANAAAKDIRAHGGRGGRVFEAWADIDSCLGELEENRAVRQEARDIYLENYSEASWIAAIETLYAEVIDR